LLEFLDVICDCGRKTITGAMRISTTTQLHAGAIKQMHDENIRSPL